jgi:hypothetical protein
MTRRSEKNDIFFGLQRGVTLLINENKTGKDNVCKGKLSFLSDIVSKLSCLQFFHGRKSTFLELILHSLR